MKLEITQNESTYEYIDSYGDLKSECKYKIMKLIGNYGDFKIEINLENNLKEINLLEYQMKNLYNFLKKQKEEKTNIPEIQCYDFCNYINGINKFDEYKKEKINEIDISKINIGDNILICEIDENLDNNLKIDEKISIKKPFFHFAIYIGNGLYISKFGKGNIYVTTFEEMHKIYNYSNLYILKKED